MFKHFLVPTDGSDLSLEAATNAITFAQELGARITFMHVEPMAFTELAATAAVATYVTPTVCEDVEDAAAEVLRRARASALEKGVTSDGVLAFGESPHLAIVKAATERKCDLIVMASHGRRGVAALLVGSETYQVLTHTSIPVLVYAGRHPTFTE